MHTPFQTPPTANQENKSCLCCSAKTQQMLMQEKCTWTDVCCAHRILPATALTVLVALEQTGLRQGLLLQTYLGAARTSCCSLILLYGWQLRRPAAQRVEAPRHPDEGAVRLQHLQTPTQHPQRPCHMHRTGPEQDQDQDSSSTASRWPPV